MCYGNIWLIDVLHARFVLLQRDLWVDRLKYASRPTWIADSDPRAGK
eukprot:SAG31_NODE_32206_length_358_cov_1.513514_1_plen_46_part_10